MNALPKKAIQPLPPQQTKEKLAAALMKQGPNKSTRSKAWFTHYGA